MTAAWSKWLVPLVVIGVIAGVAIAMWFYFFGKVGSAAELLPADVMMYVRLDTSQADGAASAAVPAFGDLTDQFWKSFANQNPYFSYEEDIRPWLGKELVLAKASADLVDPFVILAEVGDPQAATKTVEKLKTRMGSRGGELAKENYKGVDIYNLEGLFNMSGGYVKGYLVLSTSLKNVKEVIDVGNGDAKALAQRQEFRDLERNLAGPDNRIVVALALKEALEATTASLGTTERLMVKQLNLPKDLLMGVAIKNEGSDLRLQAYLGSGLVANWETASPKLLSSVPDNVLAYFEGKDLARVIINWAGENLNMGAESLNWLTGEYSFVWLPRTEKKSSLGLVIEVSDADVARIKMEAAEPALILALNRLGIKGSSEFREAKTNEVPSRYASFTEGLVMDLNYAVLDNKIVLATSQSGLSDLIDAVKGDRRSLKESTVFDNLLGKIKGGDIVSLLFLNAESVSSWLGTNPDQAAADQSENQLSADFLNQILSPYRGLGLAVKKTEAGAMLIDMYLPAK